MGYRSDFEKALKAIDERVSKLETSGIPQKTEVAKALLSGALPRQRIHLVQEIGHTNRLAVLGTVGIWSLCLSRDITDWRVAWASGLSAVLIGLWRLYAKWVDNAIACLYPNIIQCELDLAIPKDFSMLPSIREEYGSSKKVRQVVAAKRIGTRGHLPVDWIALLGIVIMAIVTIRYGNVSLLSWFEWNAPLHPYVLLFLNLAGAVLLVWAMNAFQTEKGGIQRLWRRDKTGAENNSKREGNGSN